MGDHTFSSEYPGQRQRFVLIGIAYVALWHGLWQAAALLEYFGSVSLWYLPAGLRFFCLLVFGWAGVLLELAVQSVFAIMQLTGVRGVPITDFWSVNTLWRLFSLLAGLMANMAVVLPLRRWIGRSVDFTRPTYSLWFLAAAVVASLWAALMGTLSIVKLGFIQPAQFAEVVPTWMIGDFIGILTAAPFLMVRVWPDLKHYLQQGSWPQQTPLRVANRQNDLRVALITLLSLLLVFAVPWSLGYSMQFPLLALLLLLPLAIVAWRYGMRGAVLAVVALDFGLVLLMALFGQRDQAVSYQVVMIAIALVGLWLGGAVEALNRVTARYRDFAGISNDLLWETDAHGRLTEVSGWLAKYFDWSTGKSWRAMLDQESQPQLAALDHALKQRHAFRNLEIALRGTGDEPRWIHLNGLPLFDEAGDLAGYRGTAVDVSRARRAEERLQDYNEDLLREVAERTQELRQSHSELATKERHLQVILAAAPVGMLEIDNDRRCRFINVNGSALTGYSAEEAIGCAVIDFVHPDDRDYVRFVVQNNPDSEAVQWLEFRLARTHLRCTAHWIRLSHADQSANGTIMVLTNATGRSQQDERLWILAHHDALTDLPNRNLFWDRLGQAVRHAKRQACGAAVFWVDLDGFKAVNDRLGHAAGDALLLEVAKRLKKRVRDSDTVARIGGDEFAVIMPDSSELERASQVAAGLVASLAEPFELPQGTVQISGSIGVALYPLHAETAETLVQCADMAMYEAKHAGKNQVKVWSIDPPRV